MNTQDREILKALEMAWHYMSELSFELGADVRKIELESGTDEALNCEAFDRCEKLEADISQLADLIHRLRK